MPQPATLLKHIWKTTTITTNRSAAIHTLCTLCIAIEEFYHLVHNLNWLGRGALLPFDVAQKICCRFNSRRIRFQFARVNAANDMRSDPPADVHEIYKILHTLWRRYMNHTPNTQHNDVCNLCCRGHTQRLQCENCYLFRSFKRKNRIIAPH